MLRTGFLLAAVAFSSLLRAQNNTDTARNLQEVVVTATKFPAKLREVGKVMQVITRDEINRSAGRNLGELLQRQAGLTVNGATNNLGTNQSVYLQGASAGNTLILLDGVPLNDASGISAEFDINSIALNQLERIEILKGAQSTLYGSDAVAGVINLITTAGTNRSGGQVTAVAGSYDTYRLQAQLSGSDDSLFHYQVGYTRIQSGGFSSAADTVANRKFERDGFSQDAFMASLGFKASKQTNGKVFARFNRNLVDIDAGAFADDADYRFRNLNINMGTAWQHQFRKGTWYMNYQYNWVDRQLWDGSNSVGGFAQTQRASYISQQHTAETYATFDVRRNIKWLVGADWRLNRTDQSYRSTSVFGPFESKPLGVDTTRTTQLSAFTSLFLQPVKQVNVELGGRFNHHSIYGTNGTFSANASWQLHRHWRLFGNVGSGYRVPSLYQLFSEFGNAALRPEQSINTQLGVQWQQEHIQVRLNGFMRRIKDVIVFYTDPTTFASFYRNDDEQRDQGMEAEITVQPWRHLHFSANYSYVDGEIRTTTAAGKDTAVFNLFRRPAHTLQANLTWHPTRAWTIRTQWRHVSHFFEPRFAAAPFRMAGFYTWDVYADYQLNRTWRVFLDVQNLTDRQYMEIRGFTSRGLNWNAGLTFRW